LNTQFFIKLYYLKFLKSALKALVNIEKYFKCHDIKFKKTRGLFDGG